MQHDDYVLGTDEEELERLGLQHNVWRPAAFNGWRRAGITTGSTVLDVGSGPGFASLDLAEIVGKQGRVFSVERSKSFVQHLKAQCSRRRLENIEIVEADLMESSPIQPDSIDVAWCRWVACFVEKPEVLVSKIAATLRPGGRVIFHEYYDYSTWRFAPPSLHLEKFVQKVMSSWREHGGEPDIARQLPKLLTDCGLTVSSTTPLLFCVRPSDFVWRWPASFIDINLKRLEQLGLIDHAFSDSVRETLAIMERNPWSLMMTPLVLEIIAELPD